MLNKAIVAGIILLVLVVAVRVAIGSRPPDFPPEAKQALDDFVQRFEGPDLDYTIVSVEKSLAKENAGNVDVEGALGVNRWPAGICPPPEPRAEGEWCLIIDREIETSSGDRFTHFVVRQQGQLWMVEGVADSEGEVFQSLGCRNW